MSRGGINVHYYIDKSRRFFCSPLSNQVEKEPLKFLTMIRQEKHLLLKFLTSAAFFRHKREREINIYTTRIS